MSQFIKFFAVPVAVFILIFGSMISYARHDSNVRTSREVIGTEASINLGNARLDKDTVNFSKEEIIDNLLIDIALKQKNSKDEIKFEYVFLDKNGSETTDNNKICSIQYKVTLVDDENKEVSSSVQRISLKKGGV